VEVDDQPACKLSRARQAFEGPRFAQGRRRSTPRRTTRASDAALAAHAGIAPDPARKPLAELR